METNFSELCPTPIVNQVKDLQATYYSNNKKNTFFKNKQKFDCASTVCSNIPIAVLMSNTVYIIPNTNNIFVDYTIFKLFANPDNFRSIVDHIIHNFSSCIESFPLMNLHINFESFTISSLERYLELIKLFCNECLSAHTKYSSKMDKMYIYNVPKTFDTIITMLKPFIAPSIYNKIVLCDSEQSRDHIASFQKSRDGQGTRWDA